MKQTKNIFKIFALLLTFFAFSSQAFAGGSTKYYSKAEATAVGEGKVYVANNSDAAGTYAEKHSNSQSTDGQEHTYTLYAQPNSMTNAFAGWYSTEACDGEAVSTENPYQFKQESSATEEKNQPVYTFYAKFIEVEAGIEYPAGKHDYINIDSTGVSLVPNNVGLTEPIVYTSSNENVATISDDGILTPVKNGTITITASANGLSTSCVVTIIDNVAAGVTQVGNGDFEDWRGYSDSNHAPDNWNSFETASGTWAGTVKAQQVERIEGGRPGSDGIYCVDIYSRNVVSVAAQGNLTLGCINAGSMSPDAAENHNYSDIANASKSETISQVPSAIKAWVKFVPKTATDEARIAATIHDAYNYITYGDPKNDTDENKAHVIAQAEQNIPACEWTEVTIPFEKTGVTTDGQMYIIVNFSTNKTPGKGSVGDHLYIDDVELVYDSKQATVYNKNIVVAVNGVYNAPVKAPIEVTDNEDGTIDFALNNFKLDATIAVGNISLPNLAIDADGNFSFQGNIQIAAGTDPSVETWMGPLLGDIDTKLVGTIKDDYFYVNLDINVGYPVVVEIGDIATATIEVSDSHITTFCAPFTYPIPEAYAEYVTIKTIDGVDADNVLQMTEITNSVVPANTPVIITVPKAGQLPASGIYVKGTPKAGLLTGVYEETQVAKGNYVMQEQDGIVAFYIVGDVATTIPANSAYLSIEDGTSTANAFFFDAATAVSAIKAITSGKAEIFDLNGRRLSRLQKGINIVNGAKVLVK